MIGSFGDFEKKLVNRVWELEDCSLMKFELLPLHS